MDTPQDFITNLVPCDDGTWTVETMSEVSYPEDGHDTCHLVEQSSFWFIHRNEALREVIDRNPPPHGLPVLDIGGGNGYVAAMIRSLGHRVVLVEPGAAGARRAYERGVPEVVRSSVVDLDIKDESVGGIGLFDVLEHIEDDASALERLERMLAPGGRLYVTVPAHRWLWSSVDVQAGHHRRYTLRQLTRRLEDAGLEVTFASYYFWPLPLPLLLLRCLPERLHLRKGESRSDRATREHRPRGGIVGKALDLELARFRRGRTVPVGASCVAVATRRTR